MNLAKSPRSRRPKPNDPLQLARRFIMSKATPGTASVFSKADLEKMCAREVSRDAARKISDAIRELIEERKLIWIGYSRSILFLHKASLMPLISGRKKPAKRDRAGEPQTTSAAAVPDERIRAAYRELTRESGFSDVLISDLQRRSGIGADVLKPWLLLESRAGRALPTRGDWSIADADARAAAIEIAGEPHLRVRFVEG